MDAEFERTKWDIRPRFRFISGPSRRIGVILVLTVATLSVLGQTALAQTASPTVTPAPTRASTSTPTPTPSPTSTQSPTATATPGAALTLNPQQGPPGTSVQGNGSNFAPGDTVQLLFNGIQVDAETANTSGTVTFQFEVPNLAQDQYPVIAIGQTRGRAGVNFSIAGTVLALSVEQAPPGTSVTVTGGGFQPGETVQVSFNNTVVDSPVADTTGTFSTTFSVPRLDPGDYPIEADGQTSGETASATFTIGGASVSLSTQSGDVGASVTATGTGFTPGDTVQLIFNGAQVDSETADTNGNVTFIFAVPRAAPGTYLVVLTGRTSGSASASFTVTGPGLTPVATPTPGTPAPSRPTPSGTPQAAPPVPHDNRYFSQTGYRIDNDAVYNFFQSYGGIQTFGYPTSRTFTFLGCPVQFFQRQIIQVCGGQGAALLNILDPEIFPYTKVNGSTFPAPGRNIEGKHAARQRPELHRGHPDVRQSERAGHLRRAAGQLPGVLQRSGRSDDLGCSDLESGARSGQQQLHLPALPARDHALHSGHGHRKHPGGRLSEGPDPQRQRAAGSAGGGEGTEQPVSGLVLSGLATVDVPARPGVRHGLYVRIRPRLMLRSGRWAEEEEIASFGGTVLTLAAIAVLLGALHSGLDLLAPSTAGFGVEA